MSEVGGISGYEFSNWVFREFILNAMKKSIFKRSAVLAAAALLTIIHFACDDAGVGPPKQYPFSIAGKISGWTGGGDKTLSAEVITLSGALVTVASCKIDADGNFGMVPVQIADNDLFPTDSIFSPFCNGGPVGFSPPQARGSVIVSFNVFDGSQMIGTIDYNNYTRGDPPATNDFDMMYVYANESVSGGGYKLCSGDTISFYGTAQSGWSKICRYYKRVEPESITVLYFTSQPNGAEWKFHGN